MTNEEIVLVDSINDVRRVPLRHVVRIETKSPGELLDLSWSRQRQQCDGEKPVATFYGRVEAAIQLWRINGSILSQITPLPTAFIDGFFSVLWTLKDEWYMSYQTADQWMEEYSGSRFAPLMRAYNNWIELRGRKAGFRQASLRSRTNATLREAIPLRRKDTLLLLSGKSSLSEMGESLAYLLFWRVKEKEYELPNCDLCKCIIAVTPRMSKRICSRCASAGSSSDSKMRKSHRLNLDRVKTACGVLVALPNTPAVDWKRRVLSAWARLGIIAPAPTHSTFLRRLITTAKKARNKPQIRELVNECVPPNCSDSDYDEVTHWVLTLLGLIKEKCNCSA